MMLKTEHSSILDPSILDERTSLESANDSARHFRTIYTVYLILLFYTAATILSTDQELLFQAGVKQLLPAININVPIVAFYVVMPWGLLIIHLYLLAQAWLLADKVRLYLQKLKESGVKDSDGERKLLFPVPFAHLLTGINRQRILRWIIVISLIIFPIVVLIGAQIRFLPYQSEVITWQHRIVIMLDIWLLWYFWNRLIFPLENNKLKENRWWRFPVFIARPISFASTLLVIGFIVIVVDFPNSETSDWIQKIGASKVMPNHFELSEYKLVKREPSPEILADYYMGSNAKAPDSSNIEPGSATWCRYAEPFDLTARNFREANLSEAILCGAGLNKTDFSNADFQKANLREADLRGVNLRGANLRGANLRGADLREANLRGANLREANLFNVDFTDADLTDADLTDTNLTDADLQRADLTGADLQRADLTGVDLQRADLSNADLREANIRWANLRWADLRGADFQGAKIRKADLQEANIQEVHVQGATIY